MKRRTSDIIFSEFVRRRDGRCIYAFKCGGYKTDWKELQCSHWQKRRHEGTRIDPKNCDAACSMCHTWVEDTIEGDRALDAFKLKQLGQQEYNLVLLRRHTTFKKDEFMAKLIARQLLDSLK